VYEGNNTVTICFNNTYYDDESTLAECDYDSVTYELPVGYYQSAERYH